MPELSQFNGRNQIRRFFRHAGIVGLIASPLLIAVVALSTAFSESPEAALEKVTGVSAQRFSEVLMHRDSVIDDVSYFRFRFSKTNEVELIASVNQMHRTLLPCEVLGATAPEWFELSGVSLLTRTYHRDFGSHSMTLYIDDHRQMGYLQVVCP